AHARACQTFGMGDRPLCAGVTRDGARCRSVATDGAYCHYHGALALELGDAPVREGTYLQRQPSSRPIQTAAVAEVSKTTQLSARNGGPVSPSEVRSRLGELAAAHLSELQNTLLEAASSASRCVWVTLACKHCERPGRYEVSVPDFKVRVDAAVRLLEQGLGRTPQSGEETIGAPRL